VLGFSMWEDDSLPRSFDAALRQADAIATPSRFCQKLFRDRVDELALPIRVHRVPLGVDVEQSPFVKRTFQRGKEKFRVLHTASESANRRKGADVAYEAFRIAFEGQDDVELVLRSRLNSFMPGPHAADPRVIRMHGAIDNEERARIYQSAHVLLYPSRGEGFGLIPLEALATGLPSIVSHGSGMTDYAELYYPIPCKPSRSEISVAWRLEPDGWWHEPDPYAAADHLRSIYLHYRAASDHAERAAKVVRERWTYQQTAQALSFAIEDARAAHARK
jgi:glycosyltransferase involved in cell wall biosynthesis